MSWISVIVGFGLLVMVAGDIIVTLFTPSMRGPISSLVITNLWKIFRAPAQRFARIRELIGPMAFISVIALWAITVGVGWALIYWPFLPQEFLVDFGVDPDRTGGGNFISAVYFSFVVLATLGFGDVVPTNDLLRLAVVSEALLGFGLLSSAIGWFLSIDPALHRRRLLSHQVALLRSTEKSMIPLAEWDPRTLEETLGDLSRGVIAMRSDLVQFPITYYFRHADPESELSNQLPYVLELARRFQHGSDSEPTPVQIRAAVLEQAVLDLLSTMGSEFLQLDGRDPDDVLQAYVRDHAG